MNENPCSNQEIHMLFEHGFNLKILIRALSYTHDIADQPDLSLMLLFGKMLHAAMTL